MKKRETYGHQSDAWDKAVTEGPRMRCGRLDLNSYDADDRPFQNVYFEGELEEVACTGHRADFVAYAANRYHDHVATIARLAAENERLRAERDEARGLLAEYMDGDTVGCGCDYDDSGIKCFYCRIRAILADSKEQDDA